MRDRRVHFKLPQFAAYLCEHPLLAGRGVNGAEVLYVFAAAGQFFRQHPEQLPAFTAALLQRAGSTAQPDAGRG
jgi:hypothetical protein